MFKLLVVAGLTIALVQGTELGHVDYNHEETHAEDTAEPMSLTKEQYDEVLKTCANLDLDIVCTEEEHSTSICCKTDMLTTTLASLMDATDDDAAGKTELPEK